jgi:hypothetical protein
MRITLVLDDDILIYARSHAQRERISIGTVISQLAREGIRYQSMPTAEAAIPKSKYALLPARNEAISTTHIRDLLDQEGIW